MLSPNCTSEGLDIRAPGLAREQRESEVTPRTCDANISLRALSLRAYLRLAAVFLSGFFLTIPMDWLWQVHAYASGAYLLLVTLGVFASVYFWVLPREYRVPR